MIGDLQTAALVTTDGTVDWFCCPRFDSPSVFASLLDADHGGHFQIAPDRDDYVSKQLYFPDTAILITRFMTPGGVFEADGMELTLHWARPAEAGPRDEHDRIEQLNDGVRATRTLREGESAGLVLESMGGRPRPMR